MGERGKLTKRIGVSAGDVFTVECPYVRELVSLPNHDPEGHISREEWTWRPGIVWEMEHWGDEDKSRARAHGMGSVTYTVIDTHALPAPYPKRIFFTRRWRDPDGREFGKGRLFTMTAAQFSRRLRGYVPAGAYDGYVVEDMPADERTRALASPTP